MTTDELNNLIKQERSGVEISYDIKHVMGELLFRDMMVQWQDDTDDLEEAECKQDDGCGHDQNENYGEED